MFVLPAIGSIAIDATICLLWLQRGSHAMGSSFRLQMVDVVAFTVLRLVLLALFAAMFYRERRMSLRFPLLWEAVNLILIVAKAAAFLLGGAPFREAWLLLGLCAASIGLELVCVAHLHSSAGTLPRQHIFLHSAVGAMATMNLSKNPSDASLSPNHDTRGLREGSDKKGRGPRLSDGKRARVRGGDGDGALLEEDEEDEEMRFDRQNSFYERKRFLSDWNLKVEKLRKTWASKVDELAGKLAAARRNRAWKGAEGGGGAGVGSDGEGAPLLMLARMFAQEQAAIEELEDMWNRDPKWTEFFLPQYTLFLLYASFVHSSRLEELLLTRCELSVHVAHSIYWFLKAFCVQGAGVTPVGVKAIEQMLHEVVVRGERPAKSFCERGWGDDGDAARCLEAFDALREGKDPLPLGGCFGEAPAFVDELVKISVELGEIANEGRTEELRRRLRETQTLLLPSRSVYLPVGRKRHRVYRIAVEESFSFSTKDRAPYLVTLEVIDYQQRQWSLPPALDRGGEAASGAPRGNPDGGLDVGGGVGGGVSGGDGAGSPVVASGGGGNLMRMLTPRSLGQSLRGMKAEIDRTLMTTFTRGVSRESSGISGAGGAVGGQAEDVESHPPSSALPPLSRGPSARNRGLNPVPPSLSGGSAAMVGYEAIAGSPRGPGTGTGAGARARGSGHDEDDGNSNGDGDRSRSPYSPTGTNHNDAAAAAAAPASMTIRFNSNDDMGPKMEKEAWTRSPLHSPAPLSSTRIRAPPPWDLQRAPEASATASASTSLPLPTGEERDEKLDLVGTGLVKPGRVAVTREVAEATRATSNGVAGFGLDSSSCGGGRDEEGKEGAGQGGDQGKEEEEEEELLGVPIPPSFSSTDLMGMWSRPSMRTEGAACNGFSSPTDALPAILSSPHEACMDALEGGSESGRVSVATSSSGPPPSPLPAPAAPLGWGGGGGGATDARDLSEGGDDFEQRIAPTTTIATSGEGIPLTDLRGVTGSAPPHPRPREGFPRLVKGGGSGGGAGGVVAAAGGVANASSMGFRIVERRLSAGASAASASPGGCSVNSDADGTEALLLSRGSSPGSAQRSGYGAAEPRAVPTPSFQAAGIRGRPAQTPSPSPMRRRRRSGGYAELRVPGRGRESYGRDYDEEEGDEEEEEEEDTDEDEDAGSAPKVIFKERWRQKEARLRRSSKLGQTPGWRLMPVIVKAGDDLRQEQLASQFFALANRILKKSPLGARAGLRPYDIVATSPDAGIIEAIPDTVSLDALKKNDPLYTTLSDFFHRHFGPAGSEGFLRARRHFVESLAANCIVTYLLQVKDRHNGNILLDARGRVIHIDFGFMLANSPGGNFKFESAPFKLTAEFVDLMDGPSSACFKGFREVCVQTFMTLRRKMPRLILLLETSSVGNAHLPCFGGRPEAVVGELRSRFKPEVHDRAAMVHVQSLVDRSMGCWRTCWYDWYQNYTVGIAV